MELVQHLPEYYNIFHASLNQMNFIFPCVSVFTFFVYKDAPYIKTKNTHHFRDNFELSIKFSQKIHNTWEVLVLYQVMKLTI